MIGDWQIQKIIQFLHNTIEGCKHELIWKIKSLAGQRNKLEVLQTIFHANPATQLLIILEGEPENWNSGRGDEMKEAVDLAIACKHFNWCGICKGGSTKEVRYNWQRSQVGQ